MFAKQQTAIPTNKLITMNLVTILTFHFGDLVIPLEVMEAYGFFISLGLGLGASWFMPDTPNVPYAEKPDI